MGSQHYISFSITMSDSRFPIRTPTPPSSFYFPYISQLPRPPLRFMGHSSRPRLSAQTTSFMLFVWAPSFCCLGSSYLCLPGKSSASSASPQGAHCLEFYGFWVKVRCLANRGAWTAIIFLTVTLYCLWFATKSAELLISILEQIPGRSDQDKLKGLLSNKESSVTCWKVRFISVLTQKKKSAPFDTNQAVWFVRLFLFRPFVNEILFYS